MIGVARIAVPSNAASTRKGRGKDTSFPLPFPNSIPNGSASAISLPFLCGKALVRLGPASCVAHYRPHDE